MSFGSFIFWVFIFAIVFGFGIYFGKQMYKQKDGSIAQQIATQPAAPQHEAPVAPAAK